MIEGAGALDRSEFSIQKQIGKYLEWKKKEGQSLRRTLVGILTRLEIENGHIEEYEEYEPSSESTFVLSKRKSSNSSASNAPRVPSERASSIWDRYSDSYSSASEPKFYPKLSKLISFERDLQ